MASYHFAHIIAYYEYWANRLMQANEDATREMFMTELYDSLCSIDSNLKDIDRLAASIHHPAYQPQHHPKQSQTRLGG